MKKFLAAILALCMIFALAACGSSSAPAESAPASSGSEAAPAASDNEASASAGAPIEISWCCHTATGWHEKTMQRFIQNLKDAVGEDRVVETYYTAGTMGSETELSQAVILDDLTMSIPADSFNLPNIGVPDWTSIPGIVTSREEAFNILLNEDAPLNQYIEKQFEEGGIIRLGGLDNGFRCIATSKPCETLADLQGLKTRVANSWGMVALYNGVGLQSTIIDSSEVISALQQGTIDAVENGLVNLVNQGYADLLDKCLAVNFVYSTRSMICNKAWFDALAPADQEAVRAAAREATDWCNEQFGNDYQAALDDPRWTVVELSDEQYEAFKASAAEALKLAYDNCNAADVDYIKEVTGLGA